jgi:PPOX class probable F420-dependent enzyme
MTPTTATAARPDRDGLHAFLSEHHRCVLITRRADGSLQSSPVSCGLDDAGRLLVSTYPERAKVANVRRDPAVSACVVSDDWNGPYVHLDGAAEVLDLPAAADDFVTYFRSISGEHPDWDEYREAMVRQGKCLIRVTIERWGPIATGGFPARLQRGDSGG